MVVTLYSNSSVGWFKLLGVYHGYDTVHSNRAVITAMKLYTPLALLAVSSYYGAVMVIVAGSSRICYTCN